MNAQGDVIALVNTSGATVVEYTYDAWGNVLTTTGSLADTLGKQNPFRYRGYVYDEETGLYYLQSRYYNPERGRFINADGQLNDDLLGNNQFAYCGNNPTTRQDKNGEAWVVTPFAFACGAAGALLSGAFKIATNISTGEKWSNGLIGSMFGGFAFGFVSVATLGNTAVAGYASAAVESAVNEVVSYIPGVAQFNSENEHRTLSGTNIRNSAENLLVDTAVNGTLYALTGKLAEKIIPVNFKSWFQPKQFGSCFRGNFAIKAEGQTIIQNGLLWGYSTAQAIGNELYKRQRQTIEVMT